MHLPGVDVMIANLREPVFIAGLLLCFSFHPVKAGNPDWQFQLEHYPDNLWLVSSVSRDVCWILGVHGTVLRTANAGRTWAPVQDTRITGRTLTALVAFSANVALVGVSTFDQASARSFSSGDTAWIFRTSDGGLSWHEVFCQKGGFFNSLHRLGARGAICLGNPVDGRWTVVISPDDGIRWTPAASAPLQAGAEIGSLRSSAVWGERHVWFGAYEERSTANSSLIYRSRDGGKHWTSTILPFPLPHTLGFRDSLVGIVSTTRRNIARTTDGGESWSVVSLPYDEGSGDVAASADGQIWLTQHRSILSSTDAGLTWTRLWQAHPSHQIVMKLDLVMEGDSLFGWATTWTGGIARFEGRAKSGTW
jgi:photosystem II stability/assembly factor-like uncharacterized protein